MSTVHTLDITRFSGIENTGEPPSLVLIRAALRKHVEETKEPLYRLAQRAGLPSGELYTIARGPGRTRELRNPKDQYLNIALDTIDRLEAAGVSISRRDLGDLITSRLAG